MQRFRILINVIFPVADGAAPGRDQIDSLVPLFAVISHVMKPRLEAVVCRVTLRALLREADVGLQVFVDVSSAMFTNVLSVTRYWLQWGWANTCLQSLSLISCLSIMAPHHSQRGRLLSVCGGNGGYRPWLIWTDEVPRRPRSLLPSRYPGDRRACKFGCMPSMVERSD